MGKINKYKQSYSKNNWLPSLQQGKGLDVSRLLFTNFTTRTNMTKKLHAKQHRARKKKHPNKPYNESNISRLCKLWEDCKFIDYKTIPVLSKTRYNKNRTLEIKHISMNFEPIYLFLKKKRNALALQEKRMLGDLLGSLKSRQAILKSSFKDEDIINATLKFYVKNLVLADFFYQRDRKIIANNDQLKIQSLRDNKPLDLGIDYNLVKTQIKEKYGHERDNKNKILENIDHPTILLQYKQYEMSQPSMIKSLDKKIMSSLGLY